MPLSLTRAELAALCEGELAKIRSLVQGCLEEASTEAGSLAGAQAFGGGCRMPIVQDAIREEVRTDTYRRDSFSRADRPCMVCEGAGATTYVATFALLWCERTCRFSSVCSPWFGWRVSRGRAGGSRFLNRITAVCVKEILPRMSALVLLMLTLSRKFWLSPHVKFEECVVCIAE